MSISLFNSNTLIEFKKNIELGIMILGSAEKNKQLVKDEKVMIYNMTTKKVVGIAIVASPPVQMTLIDRYELYSENKYNKYEIPLINVHIFREELNYTEVLLILGLTPKTKNSMNNYQHFSKGGIRKFNFWGLEKEEKEEKINLLSLWMNSFLDK